jgi:hypothetical protein
MIHAALIVSVIAGSLRVAQRPLDGAMLQVSAATGIVADPDTEPNGTGDASEGTSSLAGPRSSASGFSRDAVLRDTVPPRSRRPRAIEYSDWYYRRLTMHRIASYAELPLFAGEYVLGERLLHYTQYERAPSGLKTAHVLVAGGLGTLFAFNTVTGGWNLWESRKDPAGRTRRILHTVLMLAADGGFFATAAAANGGGDHHDHLSNQPYRPPNNQLHQRLAEVSMGIGLAGTVMMWAWRN